MAELGRVVKVNCFFAMFWRVIRAAWPGLLRDLCKIGQECGQICGHILNLMIRYLAAMARGVCPWADAEMDLNAAGLLRVARAKGMAGMGCALVAMVDFIQRGVFMVCSCGHLLMPISRGNGAGIWQSTGFVENFKGNGQGD